MVNGGDPTGNVSLIPRTQTLEALTNTPQVAKAVREKTPQHPLIEIQLVRNEELTIEEQ